MSLRFRHHLTGEDIADGVHHDFGFFVAIVAHQLAEILKAQTDGNFVASGGGNQVIQSLKIYRRKLVDDDRRFQHSLLVDELHDT